ncbi:MAG TPA: glycosyltransferase family 2 protein [Streptosporangiaceae bacterium]|nr:glycosyltransferase family 2 protein [Streptosporangiaceae bacterium]
MSTAALWGIGVLLLPALAIAIDGFAGVYSRDRKYTFGNVRSDAFRLLVPIWGDIRYLTNVDALAPYGPRVTLCTTGDETDLFYAGLHRIAAEHGFGVFTDEPRARHRKARGQQARSTGGTTRDRLIRNALAIVTEPYVIPIDADTVPARPFEMLAGEVQRRGLDLASVRIVPANPRASLLTRLQTLEYRLAMQIKFVAPWMLSGACHAARTEVLADVMNRHSLFFQGNDVETGLIADARGYRVGHVAFEVLSDVPERFRPWLRQRLAWAGGQFRLFIVNFRFIVLHPFMWIYGAGVTYLALILRWQSFAHSTWRVPAAAAGYLTLVLYLYLHRGRGKSWALAMPLYTLVLSFILTPLGLVWYAKMAVSARNWGLIRPNRRLREDRAGAAAELERVAS